jgi:hypothetical protein
MGRYVPRSAWAEQKTSRESCCGKTAIHHTCQPKFRRAKNCSFALRRQNESDDHFQLADEPDGIAYRSPFLWLRNNLGRCFDSGYRLANLPVVSVRIDDPSQAPTMLISDWPHRHGSGSNGLGECRVWVIHNHHHTNGSSAKGFRTEVLMFGRLVRYPKLRSVYRQASHYGSVRCINAIHNLSTKS